MRHDPHPGKGKGRYPNVRRCRSDPRIFPELADRQFDSGAECARAEELALLQRAGLISDLDFQRVVRFGGKSWRIDFRYTDHDGVEWWEELKAGLKTREYKMKLALFEQCRPCRLRIVEGKPGYFRTTQEIIPDTGSPSSCSIAPRQ